MKSKLRVILATIAFFLITTTIPVCASDPLPSWNDGKTKDGIIHFVEGVTKKNGPQFVPEPERIATFDNDGTLWVEQPMYVQVLFALERVKALAPQHPEWKDIEPFKSVIAGDLQGVLAGGNKALVEIIMASHAGMTTDQFGKLVAEWLATAEDARFKRHYTQLVYQPMLELLSYLRSNGFKTFIVTGGGIEFVRAFSEKCYGIPPEQVVGSCGKMKFDYNDGKPVIMRLQGIDFIDDGAGKPVGIERFIGRHPIAAFGNSDGDLQMLQWTSAGEHPHFCLYVHHTDAAREYAYDRTSKVGALNKGLDEAARQGWTVVDMKNDWKTIFPADSK